MVDQRRVEPGTLLGLVVGIDGGVLDEPVQPSLVEWPAATPGSRFWTTLLHGHLRDNRFHAQLLGCLADVDPLRIRIPRMAALPPRIWGSKVIRSNSISKPPLASILHCPRGPTPPS